MEAYRGPVPDTVAGAERIDTAAAHRLWAAGEAGFVDVLPRPEKPKDLPPDVVWRDKPRDSIPGALWAPNTGYGALDPGRHAYLRAVLERASGGDRAAPVVLFCLRDCWMSWNAAKRAATEYGYARIYWYPDGTDGWAEAGHPLERVEPAPRP
jgi:PQQ-dependent catabolism-associated CXXCW motif protein